MRDAQYMRRLRVIYYFVFYICKLGVRLVLISKSLIDINVLIILMLDPFSRRRKMRFEKAHLIDP